MAEELDKALEEALQLAVIELRDKGFVDSANALRVLRDHILRTRELIVARIKEYGILTLEAEQRQQLMGMLASEMVKQAVRDAQERGRNKEQAFWTTRSAKIGFVVGLATLFSIAVTLAYDTLNAMAHPVHLHLLP